MTTAFLGLKDGKTAGFSISGHSGFAPSGKDIVCAAVSSAAYFAANLLSEIDTKIKICLGEDRFLVFLSLPGEETERVMRVLRLQLLDISKQYPENLRLCCLNFKGGTHNDSCKYSALRS